MARTINEIHTALIAEKEARQELAGLTSQSRVSIWRWKLYVVATGIWALENIFDAHRAEVVDITSRMKPHSLKWYAEKARAFQFGYDLPPDSDVYDNSALTDDEIADSQIVDYAAVVEGQNVLRVKVATDNGTDLEPLDNSQLAAFVEYMNRIKDAGVRLVITTATPDLLKLKLVIYYNPLILDSNGARLDGGANTPVPDAIRQYLRQLPFNGVFVLAFLIDRLQAVDGVVVPHLVSAEAKYGALPYQLFNVEYQPDAGYLRLADSVGLDIQYIPKNPVN